MTDTVIKVENLSKLYRIGSRESGYRTFRETLVDAVKAPLQRIGGLFSRHSSLVTHHSEDLWALKDVSFEVKQGEVLGIIGRNGAGKSTLLKILSKITEPTEGRVELKGRIGSLLEVGTGFHPELTGHENVYLYGAILGMDRWEITRKFDEIVAFAELEKFIDTPVKKYSSGMYMRLAFAVAAHLEPEILLVDEVLAVGDIAFQKKCLGKMGDVANAGRTVLFVSHNMGAISRLCRLCLYLKSGSIKDSGATDSIVKEYLEEASLSKGHVHFDDQTTEKNVGVCEVSVIDLSGQESSVISFKNDFYLSVSYRVSRRTPDLHISFRLNNDSGVPVLFTSNKDYTIDRELEFTEDGLYTSRALVPGHLLFPGKYHVDVAAEIHRVRVEQDIKSAISFEIASWGDLNPEESGWALTYPDLTWTTNRIT